MYDTNNKVQPLNSHNCASDVFVNVVFAKGPYYEMALNLQDHTNKIADSGVEANNWM